MCGVNLKSKLQIVDVANGTKLGTNISGEICVKSASVMTGYLNNDAATRSTIDDQGWLHTGLCVGHLTTKYKKILASHSI